MSHDKDISSLQSRYEEEASQMKDGQARTLEEVAKKHRVSLENALNNAEKDKTRMLAVSFTDITHDMYARSGHDGKSIVCSQGSC